MCISTLRVIRPVDEAPMKEFLKEFFRLIGCLYSDKPVHSSEELREVLYEQNSAADVDLVLNISPKVIDLDSTKKIVVIDKSPKNNNQSKETGKIVFLHYYIPTHCNKKVYRSLIYKLINKLWTNDIERKDLKQICNLYLKYDLFGYAQSKRAFRISRMGEVLDISGMKEMLVPYMYALKESQKNYITKMLDAFNGFYQAMKRAEQLSEQQHSVYWKYARVNVARKVKELLNVLELDWTAMSKAEQKKFLELRDYCKTVTLLNELQKINQENADYLGIFFLAANLCQGDEQQRSNADYYYKLLFESLINRNKSVYSFAYYEYGRYLEKYLNNWDRAILYYKKAADLDQLNYHALFKMGCFYAKTGNYTKAEAFFSKVVKVILEDYFGAGEVKEEKDEFVSTNVDWKNVSLKGIQYLFKATVWKCKIYVSQDFLLGAEECIQNMELFVEQYQRNTCVGTIYDEDSIQWKELKDYHETSWPVQLLQYVINEMKRLTQGRERKA